MVGHWEVDYHRDIGLGTTFVDVSDDNLVVDASFLDNLSRKIKARDNYKAVAAGIKKVKKEGVEDAGEHNCFIVAVRRKGQSHKLLFEICRDQRCRLIGTNCSPEADAGALKAVLGDLSGKDSFEDVQLTI